MTREAPGVVSSPGNQPPILFAAASVVMDLEDVVFSGVAVLVAIATSWLVRRLEKLAADGEIVFFNCEKQVRLFCSRFRLVVV